ncbi:hypothetical protein BB559_003281 [Furculomyces boomerangus]|uniref:U1-type domain-containing protein n=1 Tax=Furculomyces boomerangus TaxID=61424 RepID=A0A2T9YM56_9FUNG|nr:hypothetical protein BB559_003281 [Furculomyces boomerangus]
MILEIHLSRSFHENGEKHKLNVQRYLRDIDLKSKKDKDDQAEIDQTLKQIEKAAHASYLKDIGVKPSSNQTKSVPKVSVQKNNNLKKNRINDNFTRPKTFKSAKAEPISNIKETVQYVQPVEVSQPVPIVNPNINEQTGIGYWVDVKPKVEPKLRKNITKNEDNNKPFEGKKKGNSNSILSKNIDEDDPEDVSQFEFSEKKVKYLNPTNLAPKTSDSGTATVEETATTFKKRKKPINASNRVNKIKY